MKLNRLNRFDIFNNGFINSPNGKLVLFSDIDQLLRDETAGANVVEHTNSNPDGNEASKYICVTSDKLNVCFTASQIIEAEILYGKKPWIAKPKPVRKRKAKAKKISSE